MKSFNEFQEEMNKKVPPVTGLGGGGGGTDSITDKSKTKSFKKRIGDVGKVLTFPFHKRKKDPTEKFATEGVASLAIKGGSKVIPALMTGIGAAGTIMQSKKDKKEPSDAAAKRLENIRNNKLYRKSKNPKDPSYLEKLLRNLRKEEVAIANSMSGGGIGGSVEAGDEPPVNKEKKKKKKTYAYGGRGSRKMWMT